MRPSVDGRDTRNARGRATVRSIEREAVRLARENGPAALTVDQICAAVGISQRSFFNHFDTKEDALLGWDLPRLSDDRIREYLADPSVGVLTGALGLVALPDEILHEPALAMERFHLLISTPALAERQAARMRPLVGQVEEVVVQKLLLIAGPDRDDAAVRRAATTITAIAASLVARPDLDGQAPGFPGGGAGIPELRFPDPSGMASSLGELRWIWDRLI